MTVRALVSQSIAIAVLGSIITVVSSQEMDLADMLGGFDRIAEACIPDHSEASMNAVRVRLYRQVLAGFGDTKDIKSDEDIETLIAQTRKRIADDVSGRAARRYEAGRRGAPDLEKMARTEPRQFEQMCRATRSLRP